MSTYRFASFDDHDAPDSDDEQVVSSHTETVPVSGGPFVYKVKVTVTGDCGCDPCEKCDASKIHRFKVKNNRLVSTEKVDTSLFSKPTFIKDAEKGWKKVTAFLEDLVGASDGDDASTTSADSDDAQDVIVIDDDNLDQILDAPPPPPAPPVVVEEKKRPSFWRRSMMNPKLDRAFRDVVKKAEDAPIVGTVAKAIEGALDPTVDTKASSGRLDPETQEAFMEAVEREMERNDKMKSLGRMKPSEKVRSAYMKPSYMDDDPYVLDYPAYTDKDVSMNHPYADIPMMTAPLNFSRSDINKNRPTDPMKVFSKFGDDNNLDDVDGLIDAIEEDLAKSRISSDPYQPVTSPVVSTSARDLAAAAFAKAKKPYCGNCHHHCSVKVRTDVSVSRKKCCGC